MSTSMTSEKELLIERIFNAPRQLVWDVWTTPEHIANWYGPQGFTAKVETMDFRPGGEWAYAITGPKDMSYRVTGTFEEIVPPEKVVTHDAYPAAPGVMKILVSTVLFDDLGDQCKLTMRILFPTEEDRSNYEQSGAVWGWNSSFDRVEALLANLK